MSTSPNATQFRGQSAIKQLESAKQAATYQKEWFKEIQARAASGEHDLSPEQLFSPFPIPWDAAPPEEEFAAELEEKPWSLMRSILTLVFAGIVTAFVSDWFVQALEPTIESWGISQAFAGLVVVAIAGNAVENVVGIRLAIKNRMDYAISVVMNSSFLGTPLRLTARPTASSTASSPAT